MSQAGTGHLTESEFHRLFAVERRRIALNALAGSAVPVELDDLAETVARRENDGDPVGEETVENVALLLHHVHLPKMADLGVVEYDTRTTRVELERDS